jgi:hypothetical protein
MNKSITSAEFPAAFSAMDAAASEYWAYPNEDWQDEFLRNWAYENDPELVSVLEQA